MQFGGVNNMCDVDVSVAVWKGFIYFYPLVVTTHILVDQSQITWLYDWHWHWKLVFLIIGNN